MKRENRVYQLYCGNLDCPTRAEVQDDGSVGRLFDVTETQLDELDDGDAWVCGRHGVRA